MFDRPQKQVTGKGDLKNHCMRHSIGEKYLVIVCVKTGFVKHIWLSFWCFEQFVLRHLKVNLNLICYVSYYGDILQVVSTVHCLKNYHSCNVPWQRFVNSNLMYNNILVYCLSNACGTLHVLSVCGLEDTLDVYESILVLATYMAYNIPL